MKLINELVGLVVKYYAYDVTVKGLTSHVNIFYTLHFWFHLKTNKKIIKKSLHENNGY